MGMESKAINLILTFLIVGLLFPIALTSFFDANETGWGSQVKTIWPILATIAIVAMLILIINYVRTKNG